MVVSVQKPRIWQRMLSGRRLDLLSPDPAAIAIEDIAHGLSRVARWNGQTRGPHAYSVAQHALLVEDLVAQLIPNATAKIRLAALLHDAPEYVVGDMISPFKAVMGGDYKKVELRLLDAIYQRFGVTLAQQADCEKTIKIADAIAAYFEARHLAGFDEAEATMIFGIPPSTIIVSDAFLDPLSPDHAKTHFLDRFSILFTPS